MITLQKKIDAQSIRNVDWYSKDTSSEALPIPILGPDLMDPRDFPRIREYTAEKTAAAAAAAAAATEPEAEGEAG